MQWKTQQLGHSLDMMHRQWQLCRDWQRSGMPGGVRLCCEKAGADMVLVEVVCLGQKLTSSDRMPPCTWGGGGNPCLLTRPVKGL